MQEFKREMYIVPRKVDVRLPGKWNSNSHGSRPVHLIIRIIKWTRTSRLSIKNSLYIATPGHKEKFQNAAFRVAVQGYLAHKKTRPPPRSIWP